jgi:hypothetical protein
MTQKWQKWHQMAGFFSLAMYTEILGAGVFGSPFVSSAQPRWLTASEGPFSCIAPSGINSKSSGPPAALKRQ